MWTGQGLVVLSSLGIRSFSNGSYCYSHNSKSPEEIQNHEAEPAAAAENDDYAQFVQTYASNTADCSTSDAYLDRLIPSSGLSQQTEAKALYTRLWTVFTLIFEPVLTLWIGPDCSPYVVPDHVNGLFVTQWLRTQHTNCKPRCLVSQCCSWLFPLIGQTVPAAPTATN